MQLHRVAEQAEPGWRVWGSDDREIGQVSELGDDYLGLTKGLIFGKHLYVPDEYVDRVDDEHERVYLKVGKAQVDSMGWSDPPGPSGDAVDDVIDLGPGGDADDEAFRLPR